MSSYADSSCKRMQIPSKKLLEKVLSFIYGYPFLVMSGKAYEKVKENHLLLKGTWAN